MLNIFMGRCSPIYGYLPTSSLNELVDDEDGDVVELIDTIVDPRSEGTLSRDTIDRSIDARSFFASLPSRLQDIAHRTYSLDQSQGEIASDLGITRSAVCHALAKINVLGRAYFESLP